MEKYLNNSSIQKEKRQTIKPLNWQNDPLLFDLQPQSAEHWLTANELIASGKTSTIFLKETSILNLFPILARKVDFVKTNPSDRILSRFPFQVLTEEEKELIQDNSLHLAQILRNYFYRSINEKVGTWQRKINHYLKRGAMPYPFVRCFWEAIDEVPLPSTAHLTFESARGKRYTIPVKVTKLLAYLCGVINGDGHLRNHWLRIVDETKEHILFLSELLQSLFNDSGEIFKTRNAWNVELRSSSAVRLINFLTSQSIDKPKYQSLQEPKILHELGKEYRIAYWKGVMDADGTFCKQLSIGSASKSYLRDFQAFLTTLNISSTIKSMKNNAFLLWIPVNQKRDYAEIFGVFNPKKMTDFIQLLQSKTTTIAFQGINKQHLTPDNFFDFRLLSPLYIVGLNEYLEYYRADRSYKEIRERLELSQGSFSQYEKGKRALPLELLEKIIFDHYGDVNSLMPLLFHYKEKARFRISTSKPIKLPLKWTSQLEEMFTHLIPRTNWTRIINPHRELLDFIGETFGIAVISPKIDISLITHFLKSFGNYQVSTVECSNSEIEKLKEAWQKEKSIFVF